MSWDAMIAGNAKQLRADHGLIQQRREDEAWQADRHNYGVSFKQGFRSGWWSAVEWVLNQQARWDDLTEHEAILELGKGSGSVYWPLFADDQRIIVDCPTDGRVSISKEGICDACGFDFAR